MSNTDTTAPATPSGSNDLVVKWRTKFPKVYDHIDDATLTQKILAKYPIYAPLTVKRPSLLSGLKPSTGFERVGERIQTNLEMIPKALDAVTAEDKRRDGKPLNADDRELLQDAHSQAAGARHMAGLDAEPILGSKTLGQTVAAATIAPRMVYDQAKQYIHDPSAFFGDLVLLVPELSEMHGVPDKKFAPGTPEGSSSAAPKLDVETQAKYTDALDKANTEYQADAKDYHVKLTKAFNDAKREHIEAVAKHGKDAAVRAEAESNAYRAKTLALSAKDKIKQLFGNLKETYRTGKAHLDQRWGAWNEAVKGAEIDPKAAFDAIEKAKVESLRGAPGSLPVLNNLLKEMGIQEFVEGEDGTLTAVPGQSKLPIETARTHYSAIGEELGQTNALGMSDLPGNVRHALQYVQNALDQTIIGAAEAKSTPERNLAGEYRTLKNDEHTFRTDWTDKQSPLAKALSKLDANYLEPMITGRGNEFIARQLGRYKQFGGDPSLVTNALRDINEAKAAAKAGKSIPEAPQPELPKKSVPDSDIRAQGLKPVERPTASSQKLGIMSKAAAKVVGKLGGAAAGTLIGHPMVGWAAGGELAPQLLERMMNSARKRTTTPITVADMNTLTPVEHTGIQNGIARRLMEAAAKGEQLPPLQKFKDVLTPEQMREVMQATVKGKVQ